MQSMRSNLNTGCVSCDQRLGNKVIVAPRMWHALRDVGSRPTGRVGSIEVGMVYTEQLTSKCNRRMRPSSPITLNGMNLWLLRVCVSLCGCRERV